MMKDEMGFCRLTVGRTLLIVELLLKMGAKVCMYIPHSKYDTKTCATIRWTVL